MKTAQQQACEVANKIMRSLNASDQSKRTRFMLVQHPGTLASGFAARFFAADGTLVDAQYIGIYLEPFSRSA